MKTYGLPYKGSKDKLAEKICSLFPQKENFYDLFCGGYAITHYVLKNCNFQHYYANDINPLVHDCFWKSVKGEFKNENRWISKEDFDKLKNTDPYVAFCFSFGNDLKSYAYGKDVEPYKKALHYAIVFQDYSLLDEIFPSVDFTFLDNIKDMNDRRLKLQQFLKTNSIAKNTSLENSVKTCDIIQNINRLNTLNNFNKDRLYSNENLQSLIQFESLNRLESLNQTFKDIVIKPNSVIYCDIPYKDTNKYNASKDFNHEEFYDWCEKQTELCFISEYEMPRDRFTCIAEFEHRGLISAKENQLVIERVFLPNHQVKDYKILDIFDL